MTRLVRKMFSPPGRHPKAVKNGQVNNVYQLILHLAPADLSGHEVCPMRSPGCTAGCLNTAGFHHKNSDGTDKKHEARVARTKLYFENRDLFMVRVEAEIANAAQYCHKHGLKLGVRLNGTSDIPWERVPLPARRGQWKNLMERFSSVPFYDYTKRHNRKDLPKNYRLTFSRSEDNDLLCVKALEDGMNVAIVFNTKPKDALPTELYYLGKTYPVLDGDVSDWRYGDYDIDGGPFIIGLRAKGKAKQDTSGFVWRLS